MNGLRRFLDKQKPHFSKGGRLSALGSTFDAIDTFLFVPKHTVQAGAHIRDAVDLKRTMSLVIIALIPCLLFGMYNVGYQHYLVNGMSTENFADLFAYGALKVLPIVAVSYIVGLGIEFLFAQLRGHQVNEGFLVSGMLIPLIMPVNAPLWMVAISTAFAVVIGKEVFGGTGMNIWNPALVARAFYFFSYPKQMSGDQVWIAGMPDGTSGATPLAGAAELVKGNDSILENLISTESVTNMITGLIPGSIGETSFIAIMIGAAILLFTGVASWRIMFSVFVGGAIMGLIFNFFGVNDYMTEIPFWQHFIMGGFAFGAVFMATDPVTGAQTSKGKIIYGLLIGLFAVLIRVVNGGFPESMMLSILMMNTFAPLIDHYVVKANMKRRLKRVNATA